MIYYKIFCSKARAFYGINKFKSKLSHNCLYFDKEEYNMRHISRVIFTFGSGIKRLKILCITKM